MPKKPTGAPKRGRGRPPKPAAERKRGVLAMRIRDGMKEALARRAAANQRSISEEGEALLEQALQSPNLLDQALDLAFGRQVCGLILAVAQGIRLTGMHTAFAGGRTVGWQANLFTNPWAFDEVVRTVNQVLEAMRPTGKIRQPESILERTVTSTPAMLRFYEKLGTRIGSDLLQSILGAADYPNETIEISTPIAKRLGPDVLRVIAEFRQREHKRQPTASEQADG